MPSIVRAGSLLTAAISLVAFANTLAAQGDGDKIEKCEKPIGTIAVVEPPADVISQLRGFQLGSPALLIGEFIQASNCFQLLNRGAAADAAMRERQLINGGAGQAGSNIRNGQVVATDFNLEPGVQFSANKGGIGGIIGNRMGLGLVGLKFKEAETSMALTDARTLVQVTTQRGKATKTDFGFAGLGLSGPIGGLGGYTNTAEGKVIAASYLDNFNKLVVYLREHPEVKPSAAVKVNAVFNEGDVVHPKINNIQLLDEPRDGAKSLTTLKTSDDMVVVGDEKDGFLRVQSASGKGWVEKTLVMKGSGGGNEPAAAAPSGMLSAAFVGTWRGTLVDQTGRSNGQTIVVELKPNSASGMNLGANCSASLVKMESTETRALYRVENVAGRCLTNLVLEFLPAGPDALNLRIHATATVLGATSEAVVATAAMKRA